jgi:hypothetical protein
VTPVANVLTPTGTEPLIVPPTTPGTSCATCAARRPLRGVCSICCVVTVRPITDVSTWVAVACTCTVSVRLPRLSWTSTLMFTPALSVTPVFVTVLNPDSAAFTRYSPTGTFGKV